MRAGLGVGCVLGLLLFSGASALRAVPQSLTPSRSRTLDAAKVARGEYLVKHTSMCDDCHTLHDAQGWPIKEKHLLGAKIVFTPIRPMPWADTAPSIAGLTFLTDEQAVVFFTTGKMPDGKLARPPMPPYRFSKADAEALTAYLKALPPAPAN